LPRRLIEHVMPYASVDTQNRPLMDT